MRKSGRIWVCMLCSGVEEACVSAERWKRLGFRIAVNLVGESDCSDLDFVDYVCWTGVGLSVVRRSNLLLRSVILNEGCSFVCTVRSVAVPDDRFRPTDYIAAYFRCCGGDIGCLQMGHDRVRFPCVTECHLLSSSLVRDWNGGGGLFHCGYRGRGYALKELSTILAMYGYMGHWGDCVTSFPGDYDVEMFDDDGELFSSRSLAGYPGHEPVDRGMVDYAERSRRSGVLGDKESV